HPRDVRTCETNKHRTGSSGEGTTNRPDNTAFDQQRLPAWQPVLSAGIVIPGFLLVGLAFIGIGVALFVTSRSIQVLEVSAPKGFPPLAVPPTRGGPVFLYYGLSNYFQNVRGYGCLAMTTSSGGTCPRCSPSSSCAPYQYDQNTTIAPCGSVANSMFNDTFTLYQLVNATRKTVPLDGKGIAWWTDYNIKFRNPPEVDGSLAAAFNGTVKPVNWPKPVYDLDPTNPANNGFLNQDFLVWMRTAALPDFWKLYRRITEGEYASGLPAGNYTLEIQYNYPVANFAGRKSVIFSNTSWMGGKNQFLGIAYLVTGSLCVVMSAVMLIVYAKFNSPDEDF
uniref:Cell cycle control protein n=1 Tax=Scleropages formosus TaxID=113540 RepID=A0A8C9WB87_SCLFO